MTRKSFSLRPMCSICCAIILLSACTARSVTAEEPPASIPGIRIEGSTPLLADSPLQEEQFSDTQLESSPALTVDDFLRQLPGFSLFRRTSSIAAHPTTQGAAFRGLAATGASRALVLLDGIPVNDPFGGWVLWNRIPLANLRRLNVVEGWGPLHWSTYGLSGSISGESFRPEEQHNELFAESGNEDTENLSLNIARQLGAPQSATPAFTPRIV